MRSQTLEAKGPLRTLTTNGTVRPSRAAEHEDQLWPIRGPRRPPLLTDSNRETERTSPKTIRAWLPHRKLDLSESRRGSGNG